jgi:hypothetical protein
MLGIIFCIFIYAFCCNFNHLLRRLWIKGQHISLIFYSFRWLVSVNCIFHVYAIVRWKKLWATTILYLFRKYFNSCFFSFVRFLFLFALLVNRSYRIWCFDDTGSDLIDWWFDILRLQWNCCLDIHYNNSNNWICKSGHREWHTTRLEKCTLITFLLLGRIH